MALPPVLDAVKNMDISLFFLINHISNPVLNYIMLVISWLGERAAVYFLFCILAVILDKKQGKKVALFFIIATIIQLIVIDVFFRSLLPRPRPFIELENVRTAGILWLTPSFPSGHAASAFAGALIFGAYYKKFKIPLYALAVLMAVSRVYTGAHYPSDAVAGALIGILVGLLTLYMNKIYLKKNESFHSN